MREMITNDQPWMEDAACRGMDSSVFYYPDGERGHARKRRVKVAKAICRQCPVLEECRSFALNNGEKFGVWGGMSEAEREAYQKSMGGNTPESAI